MEKKDWHHLQSQQNLKWEQPYTQGFPPFLRESWLIWTVKEKLKQHITVWVRTLWYDFMVIETQMPFWLHRNPELLMDRSPHSAEDRLGRKLNSVPHSGSWCLKTIKGLSTLSRWAEAVLERAGGGDPETVSYAMRWEAQLDYICGNQDWIHPGLGPREKSEMCLRNGKEGPVLTGTVWTPWASMSPQQFQKLKSCHL